MQQSNRREVDWREHLGEATRALADPGLLLCAEGLNGGPPNAMAIGWATFGVIWGLPICVVLVRPSRYTYRLIEASQEFTVCLPAAGMEQAVSFCGTVSGREHDKFAEAGLTALPSLAVRAPTVAGSPATFECKVVHWNDVVPAHLAPTAASAYPHRDYHRVYFGQTVACTARS